MFTTWRGNLMCTHLHAFLTAPPSYVAPKLTYSDWATLAGLEPAIFGNHSAPEGAKVDGSQTNALSIRPQGHYYALSKVAVGDLRYRVRH